MRLGTTRPNSLPLASAGQAFTVTRPRPEQNRMSLVAAAQLKKRNGGKLSIKEQAWQKRLWDLYDAIGEIRFGVNFKRNAIRRVNFQMGQVLAPGEAAEIIEDPNNPAVDELLRLEENALGGLPELVGSLSVNLDIAAEGYLVGSVRDDVERFEGLSVDEVIKRDKSYVRTDQNGSPFDQLTDEDFILRIWRPHPRYQNRPDSGLLPYEPQCEELLMISKAARAAYLSRLSNGILLFPEEIGFPEEDVTGFPLEEVDGANEQDVDPVQAELIEAMMAPITDLSSAAALVPLVLRSSKENLAAVKHIVFSREVNSADDLARTEALLTRIAFGIDLPPEVLTGIADLNHWSAWMIDEKTYTQHVDPQVSMITEAITRGYLWPALQERGVPNFQTYQIEVDSSGATSHPDSLEDALQLFDRGAIGFKALLRATGFTEDDMPTAEEIEMIERIMKANKGGGSSSEDGARRGPPASTNPAEVSVTDRKALSSSEGEAMVAAGDQRVNASGLSEIDLGLMARLQAASDAAVTRALERAGARLRTKTRKDEGLAALIDGVPNTQVAMTIGRERVEALQVREQDLIPPDTFDQLGEQARAWIEQAQTAAVEEVERMSEQTVARDTGGEASDRDSAVEWLIAALLALAVGRLFTPDATTDPAETGEVSDITVDSVLVANAASIAGGSLSGLPDSGNRPNNWAAGIGNGERTSRYLTLAGLGTVEYIWRYGDPSARNKNFEPHRRLNGVQFGSWTDAKLKVGFGDGWIGRTHYQPRDHKGCLCWYERVLTSISVSNLTSVT